MMCQCRPVNCCKRSTLVSYIFNGGGYAPVCGEQGIEISIVFSQFCCESETALKKSIKNVCEYKEYNLKQYK